MLKILKYILLFIVFSLGFTSTTSCKSKKNVPKTHHPNLRKASSGKTNNCDCPKVDRKGRPISNVNRGRRR